MKTKWFNIVWIIVFIGTFVAVHAAIDWIAAPDAGIVGALNEQNRQLARIAEALERISGQRPGWKLPKP